MKRQIALISMLLLLLCVSAKTQTRQPESPVPSFSVKTKKQISDIVKALERESGNKSNDIVPPTGRQMRVAVLYDTRRVNDMAEVHNSSDDIYYVLKGEATLMLGGKLDDPKEISPVEWRSKTVSGGEKIKIRKGDVVVIQRGTSHQRTVTGKGFSMVLIKVFREAVK